MCELLGMSANVPTDICFSFSGFLHRGGGTGPTAMVGGSRFMKRVATGIFAIPTPRLIHPLHGLYATTPLSPTW